ncbi:MAG: hypothetical protein ACLQIB_40120 [Isosphaeraceae bacterium]
MSKIRDGLKERLFAGEMKYTLLLVTTSSPSAFAVFAGLRRGETLAVRSV